MHPIASSCFLLFLFFRFSGYLKCPKNSGKVILKISVTEPSGRTKREQEGHHQGPRRVPGAAQPRQGASWLPGVPPRLLPSPIFTARIRNPWTETLFRETLSVPP